MLAKYRYAYAVLEKKFRRAEKRKQPVGIITFDIDEFKAINDSYGHDYGDYVLKEITRIVKRITRKEDILIRWGGDEFLLLLVNRDKAATEKFINDLNDTIKTICSRRYVKEENIYITLSVGYSLFPEDTKNLYQLITIADERMYEVKRGKKSS
ncbi:GGDEF domain-containing protein [Oceanobacillus luteolus]|uniref:GGDEF domain-containing protein n=1 Tax=Oceanobacillus luteolus TaxID=1274358 RepID=A0ABW4HU45_9BACI